MVNESGACVAHCFILVAPAFEPGSSKSLTQPRKPFMEIPAQEHAGMTEEVHAGMTEGVHAGMTGLLFG